MQEQDFNLISLKKPTKNTLFHWETNITGKQPLLKRSIEEFRLYGSSIMHVSKDSSNESTVEPSFRPIGQATIVWVLKHT